MRDIQFRGKRPDNNEWVYGYLLQPMIISNVVQGQLEYMDLIVDENTVGQYIGLKDNSEQKVFEGDILYDPTDSDNGLYVVEFMDGEFVLINDNIIYEIEQVHFLHIIGNIHDNKELLTNGGN